MPQSSWSNAEWWVWDQIRDSKAADFNAEGWKENPELSVSFVRDIFYDESLAKQIPPEGVRIAGGCFRERLKLFFARLHRQLWLSRCQFYQGINLAGHINEGSLSLEGSYIVAPAGDAPALDLQMARIERRLSLEGAVVRGALNMGGLWVGQDLYASVSSRRSEFAGVALTGANIEGSLSLDGATVTGNLMMNGLRVGHNLVMRGSKEQPATFSEVDLTGANIEGELNLEGATVERKLQMNGVRVGRDLHMGGIKERPAREREPATEQHPAKFAEVELTGANIEGDLDLDGATVKATLTMNGLHVGRNLFMQGRKGQQATKDHPATEAQPARFAKVDLTNANIEGQLSLSGATVARKLVMPGLRVDKDLFIGSSIDHPPGRFHEDVDLSYAKIMRGVYLDGARFAGRLRLTSTEISGELRFIGVEWPDEPKAESAQGKQDDVRLTLLGTHASELHEEVGTWPKHVELDGFTYDRIHATMRTVIDRTEFRTRYICNWLNRDATYTPQPYERLAAVFRAAGQPERAADALYESRKLAHQRARGDVFRKDRALLSRLRSLGRYLGSWLLKWIIGYGLGYRYFLCLVWIAGFTAIGTIVLAFGAHDNGDFAVYAMGPFTVDSMSIGPVKVDAVLYSLLRLVPIFGKLDEFSDITLCPWARWYFYFHQFAGYTLAGFIAAGIAGLTQKS